LGSVVGDGEQDRAGFIVGVEVDQPVGAAGHFICQAFGLQGLGEGEFDLVEVSSAETTSVIHLRETRSSMMSTAIPAAGKWVVS
jgi:hypothetical protein